MADDLVPGRDCGGCRACCKVFAIEAPELHKELGVMCVHAAPAGCGIYDRRPEPCRAFFCAWRQLAALPDEMRPDRIGAMPFVTSSRSPKTLFDRLSLVVAAVDDPAALEGEAVQALVTHFARHAALPIHLRWADQQVLVHPRPELAAAILDPATGDAALRLEAAEWRARYEAVLAAQVAAGEKPG